MNDLKNIFQFFDIFDMNDPHEGAKGRALMID